MPNSLARINGKEAQIVYCNGRYGLTMEQLQEIVMRAQSCDTNADMLDVNWWWNPYVQDGDPRERREAGAGS